MRIIVAGSRSFGFENYKTASKYLDTIVKCGDVILSGCARGADKLGERYAEERKLEVEKFPAQWDKYGNSAGYKRNQTMAQNADALVAFWDGKSRGTRHMIEIAKEKGLIIKIVMFG